MNPAPHLPHEDVRPSRELYEMPSGGHVLSCPEVGSTPLSRTYWLPAPDEGKQHLTSGFGSIWLCSGVPTKCHRGSSCPTFRSGPSPGGGPAKTPCLSERASVCAHRLCAVATTVEASNRPAAAPHWAGTPVAAPVARFRAVTVIDDLVTGSERLDQALRVLAGSPEQMPGASVPSENRRAR